MTVTNTAAEGWAGNDCNGWDQIICTCEAYSTGKRVFHQHLLVWSGSLFLLSRIGRPPPPPPPPPPYQPLLSVLLFLPFCGSVVLCTCFALCFWVGVVVRLTWFTISTTDKLFLSVSHARAHTHTHTHTHTHKHTRTPFTSLWRLWLCVHSLSLSLSLSLSHPHPPPISLCVPEGCFPCNMFFPLMFFPWSCWAGS